MSVLNKVPQGCKEPNSEFEIFNKIKDLVPPINDVKKYS